MVTLVHLHALCIFIQFCACLACNINSSTSSGL
uniref:Uncharacterized protein n=1 Tax=Anguilla anguilla TaxID=7936 RepID=A0A0E9V4V9_ANGAN